MWSQLIQIQCNSRLKQKQTNKQATPPDKLSINVNSFTIFLVCYCPMFLNIIYSQAVRLENVYCWIIVDILGLFHFSYFVNTQMHVLMDCGYWKAEAKTNKISSLNKTEYKIINRFILVKLINFNFRQNHRNTKFLWT